MARKKIPQEPGDIVIQNDGSGLYAIVRMDGQRIGTSNNRRNAMRVACAAADETGATVWLCVDAFSDIYSEVLCP
jgi:hypothetical protein